MKRFTHSEIVIYLMELNFTIHTYIWKLDRKFGSLQYVKIEMSLKIFLYIICMDQWLRKRHYLEIYPFWDSELLNGIPFHYSQLYLKTWHQIWKITVCENRGVTTNFSVYILHGPMTQKSKLLRDLPILR